MARRVCNTCRSFQVKLTGYCMVCLDHAWCLVYLDDIISFDSDFDSALDNLVMHFEGLCDYDLQLKANKHDAFKHKIKQHYIGKY